MALTVEQRQQRRLGIGGSDAAAILGVSKYASSVDIYDDKVSEEVLQEETPNAAMDRGNKLESIIIERFQEQSGFTVDTTTQRTLHPKYPFMFANIDGYIPSENAIVEAKSTHIYSSTAKEFGDENTDEIPQEYIIQCSHYEEVFNHTGISKVYIPVAFVNDNSGVPESIQRFAIYEYHRNDTLAKILIEQESHFWHEHVLKQVPPPGERKRKAPETFKTADEAVLLALAKLKTIKAQIKDLQIEEDTQKKLIYDFMEEFESLKDTNGNVLATWKTQATARFDSTAFKTNNHDLYNKYLINNAIRVLRLQGER